MVDWKGQEPIRGIQGHIDAMKALSSRSGHASSRAAGRMVTVAKWRDGAIAEEYIWVGSRVVRELRVRRSPCREGDAPVAVGRGRGVEAVASTTGIPRMV